MRTSLSLKIAIGIQLAAPFTLSLVADQPSTSDQIRHSKIFPQELVWVGATEPSAADSQILLNAISKAKADGLDQIANPLEEFIAKYSDSPWTASLRANLASYYRSIGRYSAALSHWEAAWESLKHVQGGNDKLVADQVLAEWTQLLAKLGRLTLLEKLMSENGTRQFEDMTYGRLYGNSIAAARCMKENPGTSYRCGTYALYQIARARQIERAGLEEISKALSPVTGFSIADLAQISKRAGLDLLPAKREQGSKIVVPSVVHWRENHYAAILQKDRERYYVVDATFGRPLWINEDVLNSETDGYFLVLQTQKPEGWRLLADDEAKSIFGKGLDTDPPQPPPPPCQVLPGKCPTCRAGSGPPGAGGHSPPPYLRTSAPGGIWSGGSTGSGTGGCSSCGGSDIGGETIAGWGDFPSDWGVGMPVWRVTEPYTVLWLEDQPMTSIATAGKKIPIFITYNQEDTRPDDTNIFNLGPNWNFNLLSYVDITSRDGSDLFQNYDATIYGPAGGQMRYTSTWTNGYPPDDYYTKAQFTVLTNSGIGGKLQFPDGSVFNYGYTVDVSTSPKRKRLFLTDRTDAHGAQEVDLLYSTVNGRVLLNTVNDPGDNLALTFYYGTAHPAQIVAVSNIYGQGATFQYDTNRMLTNITDAVGLSNSFTYIWTNSIPIMTKLITPYGTNSFEYVNPNGALFGTTGTDNINRAIRATQPNGETHIYMYRDDSYTLYRGGTNIPFIDYTYPDVPDIGVAVNSSDGLCNQNMRYRNTFYWGPNQSTTLSTTDLLNLSTNDYSKGTLRNWLHQYLVLEGFGAVGETINMQREPSPDGVVTGQKTWYAYKGKYRFNVQSTNFEPSYVARLLPNGESQYIYREYNPLSKLTLEATTYSGPSGIAKRTNTFTYSTDNIDLAMAYDRSGLPQATYYYDSHLVTTNRDYFDHDTVYAYNAFGNLTSIQTLAGLTTTRSYDANGWLSQTIDAEIGRTNSYVYTNGLLLTHTDERGLTRTFKWDALNRLASISYPDGTYESNRYDKLDLFGRKDRLGNWTYFAHDSLRRKIAETNALMNFTLYSYCSCGNLDSITDPLGNTTHFYYDLAGNRIGTVFPDGTWVSNRFDSLGRITNQFDSAGTSLTNWFNHQGLLIAQSNSLGRVQALLYDIEDRITNKVDVTGVAVGYRFDELGRMDRRFTGDSATEQFVNSYRGVTSYTDVAGRITSYGLDPASRKIVETNNNSEVIGYRYNPAGDLLFLTNAVGATTRWSYDQYGHVTNKVDGYGTILLGYSYDAAGRVTNRWSVEKGNTAYRYDALGNLTYVDYPNSPDLSFAYDKNNRLTNMLDAVGATRYTYTSFGAVSAEDGPWNSDTVSYTYANQLRAGLTLQRPSASPLNQTYSYDLAKRLTAIANAAGNYGYQYDPTHQLSVTRLTFPNGAYISNSFDAMAQMTGTFLKNSSHSILNSHQYIYDANDYRQVTRQTRTDGSYIDYGYDGIGQLTSALGKESGGTTNRLNEQLRYSYNAAGNLAKRTNNLFEQTFNVDLVDRLSTVTRSSRITVIGTTSAAATNVTVNTSNAIRYADNTFASTNHNADVLTNITAIAQDSYGRRDTNSVTPNLGNPITFSYDENGNMISDGTLAYDYDDENQLIAVYNDAVLSWRSEFVYDGKMRRRIRKEYTWQGAWVLTNEVHYVYDGNLVIQERDALNAPVVTYTRGKDLSGSLQGAGGIGGLLARTDERAGSTASYHSDRLGNVTMLLSALQFPVAKYLYDPFGNTLSSSGPLADANFYRFSSKELHVNSGLSYYLYRYYAPGLQRWINRDPISDLGFARVRKAGFIPAKSGRSNTPLARRIMSDPHLLFSSGEAGVAEQWFGPNPYQFLLNDPVTEIDPDGEHVPVILIVGEIVIGGILVWDFYKKFSYILDNLPKDQCVDYSPKLLFPFSFFTGKTAYMHICRDCLGNTTITWYMMDASSW